MSDHRREDFFVSGCWLAAPDDSDARMIRWTAAFRVSASTGVNGSGWGEAILLLEWVTGIELLIRK